MKKFISILVIILYLISVSAYALPFKDVSPDSEEWDAINKLWEYGYVNGYTKDTFGPERHLTRAEFVKITNKVFFYTEAGENKFSDVKEDDWFYNEVCIAASEGYINGMGDGRFCPEDKVTREQVCVIVNNILNMELLPIAIPEITDEVSSWAEDSVKKALSSGLITLENGGKFRGTEPITRGEACVILSKCAINKPETPEPIDLNELSDEVLNKRMTEIINILKEKVLPLCYLDAQKGVIEGIISGMNSYLEDRNFDYNTAREETFKIYASMENRDDRVALQNMISSNIYLEDLVIVYDFFFPEED